MALVDWVNNNNYNTAGLTNWFNTGSLFGNNTYGYDTSNSALTINAANAGTTGGIAALAANPAASSGLSSDLSGLSFDTTGLSDSNTFLGLSGATWQGIGSGLQGLAGLASAYTGLQNYYLAKDALNFQKDLANRNLANQAKIINNTYDNAAQVAAGMIGSKDSSGRYGGVSSSDVSRAESRAKSQYVDGSSI